MRKAYLFLALQISHRSREFQNPIIRPRRQPQLRNSGPQQLPHVVTDGAEGFDLFARHVGVALEIRAFEARLLQSARIDDAGADHFGGFAGAAGVEHFVLRETRDFDVDVDAVQEGTGDALQIFLDHLLAARTGFDGVAEVAAGTGVHGGDHHDAGGVGHGAGDAGNRDVAVFQGLTQHFEDVATKFR